MSGGQRQRVAIGRAIVRNPKVFLFDEPLSNLDAALRVATRIEIAKLKESMPNTTMIYVTHDQVEAMTLADRIVVLKDGRIEQVGTPMELYQHPGNLFVAQFIGSPAMNIVPATRREGRCRTTITSRSPAGSRRTFPWRRRPCATGASISFGVRPEDLRIATGDNVLFEGPCRLHRAARRGAARLSRHRPRRRAAGGQAAGLHRGEARSGAEGRRGPRHAAHLQRGRPLLRQGGANGQGRLTPPPVWRPAAGSLQEEPACLCAMPVIRNSGPELFEAAPA